MTVRIPTLLVAVFFVALHVNAGAEEEWSIVLAASAMSDAAIRAAVEDLQLDGAKHGLSFGVRSESSPLQGNAILVGGVERNEAVRRLVDEGSLKLVGVRDPQGFEIRTVAAQGRRTIVVAGASSQGDVYGLYWIWDRLGVMKEIPDFDVFRTPALPIRLTGGTNETGLRNALRHTANWVSGEPILDLIPWDSAPEAARNAENRGRFRSLLEIAHGLNLKYLATGDEFSYHPSLLEEFGAALSPADPALWDALQAKYRRLFDVLPELDGVQIRTGELTRVYGDYRPYDVMHEPAESDWSLEKRYRTFVRKMHEVVFGEYGKIYFHRTWVTNTSEQHSSPEVFERTFTEEVPTENLYLSPYLSTGDRWYYQPYNPTFNLTPHNMVVLLASLDYHAVRSLNILPSFPGRYFQGGLQSILAVNDSNLKGAQFAVPEESGWDTASLTAYTAFRLAWDPQESLRDIARDFAAIHLGKAAAPEMAEILLLSQQVYKDGLYIKPVAESIRGNTLPQLRLTTFPVMGFPAIDKGRTHIEWLQSTLYGPSKEKTGEALAFLGRGRAAAVEMDERFQRVAHRIEDRDLARTVGDGIVLARRLVETNELYVKTCFAYFQYRERPAPERRTALADSVEALKRACESFRQSPGYRYNLFGVEQLIANADAAVADLAEAEAALARALNEDQVQGAILIQQERNAAAFAKFENTATPLLRWRGKVDGKDILHIRGEDVWIEHIRHDHVNSVETELFRPLPRTEVTVLLKEIESRPIRPFILEQPNEQNGYTLKVYLSDSPGGFGWWEFELYYVDESPSETGLAIPWQ